MKYDIIIVLGSPNDPEGSLSDIAEGRAKTAIRVYKNCQGCKVLLTGGYGKHFNVAEKPHACYMAQYLIDHGLPPEDLLEFVYSSNTLEDAWLSRRILGTHQIKSIGVITSGYHIERARLIFEYVFPLHSFTFIEAPTTLSQSQLRELCNHEKESLNSIHKEGLANFVSIMEKSRVRRERD